MDMNVLKDFLIGLGVIIISPLLFILGFFAWQTIIGLSSFILVALVSILFLVLIFYVIVLIGYLVRLLFTKKSE